MSKRITPQLKKEIIDYYKTKPMTASSLAEHFNLSFPSITKILNEYRIKRYTKVQLFSPELNEHYFDCINTEEKAYFLGLIVTDGCIHNTKGRQSLVSLTLKDNDKYILERFKKVLNSNKAITFDGRGCSEINILSDTLVKGLKQYGLKENKSLNTIFPNNIPKDLYRHFIRGILDGDGSVSFYVRKNRKSHTKAVRFCQGNKQFLQDLINFLYEQCNIDKINIFQEKDNLWSIAYRKDDSMMKLIHYMYDDATIYLTRKKIICDLICNEILTYGSTEITIENKESMVS